MLLNCIHIVADYLVEDDIANGFFWSFIACSRYIQSSDWMSLAYHAVCSTEHWVVNFPFRFHPFYNAILLKSNKQQQITQNIFMFITKCLQWLLQWQMWIIITIIPTTAAATLNYAVCVCVIFITLVCYFGQIFTWLVGTRAYVKAHLFTFCPLNWFENGFCELEVNFTPFATYLNIWILWCVCVWLRFSFCIYVMHTHDKYTDNMDMSDEKWWHEWWNAACALAI